MGVREKQEVYEKEQNGLYGEKSDYTGAPYVISMEKAGKYQELTHICPVKGQTMIGNIIEYLCQRMWRNAMARIIDYEVQNIVGNKIRKYRLELKMSQQDLSERLETYAIYICRGSISRIESHERTVTDFELRAMAQVLKVSIEDLFDE